MYVQALEGLRVILGVRPQTLATMVPKLLRGTMTSTNCKALGSLAEVAGPAIAPHLSNIFPPLLRLASQPNGSSAAAAAAKDALIKVHSALQPSARDAVHPSCSVTSCACVAVSPAAVTLSLLLHEELSESDRQCDLLPLIRSYLQLHNVLLHTMFLSQIRYATGSATKLHSGSRSQHTLLPQPPVSHSIGRSGFLVVHGMQVAGSVSEDALYLLFAELEKGLEEGVRRPGAAAVLTHFCATSKLDYQEHVPSLLTVCPCLTSLASLALSLAPPASYPFVLRTFLHCS